VTRRIPEGAHQAVTIARGNRTVDLYWDTITSPEQGWAWVLHTDGVYDTSGPLDDIDEIADLFPPAGQGKRGEA